MAEKEKPKSNVGTYVLIIGAIVTGSITITSEYLDPNPNTGVYVGYEEYQNEGESIVGKSIKLKDNAYIYSTFEDSLNGINPKVSYYPVDEPRVVSSAFYEINNEFKRIDYNNLNYKMEEQEIIDNGGKLISILTKTQQNPFETEGFYNKDSIYTIIYGPVKS